MSHEDSTHRPHGLEGYLNQRFGHPLAERLANTIFRHPKVTTWIKANPTLADYVGEGLDALAGFGELPGNSPVITFVNRVFEVFAAESRELLEQLAANPESPELTRRATEAVGRDLDRMANTDALLALNQVHKSEDCPTIKSLVAQTTPRKPRQGPDGKDLPIKSWAKIENVKIGAALSKGAELCPHCYKENKMDTPKADTPKANPAPTAHTSDTFGGLLLDWHADDAASADAFLAAYAQLEPTAQAKFVVAFSKGGTVARLKQIASVLPEQRMSILDAMIGQQHEGVENIADFVINFVGHKLKSFDQRCADEKVEDRRFFDSVQGILGGVQEWACAERKKLGERKLASRFWSLFRPHRILAALAVLVTVAGIYWLATLNREVNKENNNHVDTKEVSHVRK